MQCCEKSISQVIFGLPQVFWGVHRSRKRRWSCAASAPPAPPRRLAAPPAPFRRLRRRFFSLFFFFFSFFFLVASMKKVPFFPLLVSLPVIHSDPHHRRKDSELAGWPPAKQADVAFLDALLPGIRVRDTPGS